MIKRRTIETTIYEREEYDIDENLSEFIESLKELDQSANIQISPRYCYDDLDMSIRVYTNREETDEEIKDRKDMDKKERLERLEFLKKECERIEAGIDN